MMKSTTNYHIDFASVLEMFVIAKNGKAVTCPMLKADADALKIERGYGICYSVVPVASVQ